MIQLESAEKFYTTRTVKTLALRDINLQIAAGEFVSIMGPSGSGKTTLLNVLGMFETLDAGRLQLAQHDITPMRHSQKIALRRQLLGYIFQSFNLIDFMSVYENIELPLKYRNVPQSERKARVKQPLEQFGLSGRSAHYPAQLSGGQQQRVAIARAMISRPTLILADEPTGNLDSSNSKTVLQQLEDINQAGTTVVMVTHSPEASEYAKRHLMMKDGYLT
ncbi:ATP-binding cassette domain-containing protein [Symbiopectobacterium purcellii]|uniref:ATP-binding cassette domain-containing protein n=1 Tax=Symbiopectobacterium purcellii TaxID=2871826 RepID=A0ABX9AT55_9ENTR|nr:ATP-binding cassette domain-containing protein [Symbiopectobacterium purcellii]QZN97946.1 ATP-binding cassette domain-containing protein [Symbiopectobacterium purcellii]